MKQRLWLVGLALIGSSACGDSGNSNQNDGGPVADAAQRAGDGGGMDASKPAEDGGQRDGGSSGGDASMITQSACSKYGGAAMVESIVRTRLVPKITGDCRINAFFAQLPQDRMTRFEDCLVIQAQELFACPGVAYAGSKASNGLACRSMKESHQGLGISTGDFNALVADVAAALTEGGIALSDLQKAAPMLVGLKDEVVEKSAEDAPTMPACSDDAGGG